MRYNLEVKILSGECWYGTDIGKGKCMPITKKSKFSNDNRVANNFNQSTPLFISTKGRFVWSEEGYKLVVAHGMMRFESDKAEIKLYEGYSNLRGAYLEASKRFFPPGGRMPNEIMFTIPQYCTWIELMTNQREEKILDYAKSILDCGMPAGELIIDDGWQRDFGEWLFDKEKFSDPKGMIKKLHDMGFKVIMWICPFVSPKAKDYQYLVDNDCFVKDASGKIAQRTWWNGTHPVLDCSNPKAVKWFKGIADVLINEYGVDGFKQDAGDAHYYKDDDITYANVSANDQSMLWHDTAVDYDFNELRACWKCGNSGVAQRLSDKPHKWWALRMLIPDILMQGISGYAYTCPDMIGGGLNSDFLPGKPINNSLFVRSAQTSALMPMMQFSKSVWRIKEDRTAELCIAAANLHREYSDYIIQLAREAKTSGEPIVRYTEYVFPDEGIDGVKQQFMLGDKYLVAPMVWKWKRRRSVVLPKGKWEYKGEVIDGGRKIKISVALDELPIFKRV